MLKVAAWVSVPFCAWVVGLTVSYGAGGCAGAEGGECVIQHTVVDVTPGLPLEHVGGAIATAGTERGRDRSHQ